MKKTLLIFVSFFACSIISKAQVGIGTQNPDPKSVLDLYSTSSGLLMPRLNNAQMSTLQTGGLTEGMVIFNTDLKKFMGWDGTKWINLSYQQANTIPQVSGAAISGTYQTGQTLTGSYTYFDSESDPDDNSVYQWYTATDNSGTNSTEIAGASNQTYTLTASDENKYIQFCVIGGSTSGASPGNQSCSSWEGPSVSASTSTQVAFAQRNATLNEGDGAVSLDFVVTNPSSTNAVMVTVQIAQGYSDFDETAPVTITIPANTTSYTATVFNITDDNFVEGDEIFTFNITSVTGGQGAAVAGSPSSDTLTITDNDFVLAAWEFLGNAGDEISVNASTLDGTISNASITRGTGISAATNADRFNANNFTEPDISSAMSNADYFEFTVTPNNNIVSITRIVFNFDRSNSGPTEGALRSSADGYASNQQTFTGLAAGSSQTVPITNINNISGPVTFRLYLYGNNSSVGSAGFEGNGHDIIIEGSAN